jgi:K(+)-stimulated pyrophosphate-energized sodium pump
MAADVFESYEVTLVAAIILGAAVITDWTPGDPASAAVLALVMYPLIVRAVGVVASIIGIVAVRGEDRADLDPMQPINRGFWISSFAAAVRFGLGS